MNKNKIQLENIEERFDNIIKSSEWSKLQKSYNDATNIFFFGHGGNMGIADHGAIDSSRLTDKNIIAPGSAITVTSLIADANFNSWIKNWLETRSRGLDKSKCLAIGFSCSINNESSNCIVEALNWADKNNIDTAMISAQYNPCGNTDIIKVVQNVEYYHTSEILSLMLTYQLIHGAGFNCPSILKKCKIK
jgi:hypothetical protein